MRSVSMNDTSPEAMSARERQIVAQALDILAKLVSFDTTSSDSNLPLIEYVEAFLAGYGVRSQRIGNEAGSKANLLASIGDGLNGGIVLSGHTDTVPVTGQRWTSDPFTLTRRGDRLYGRGTSDMKSFIALALAAVPHLLERPARRPVHLAFSYDEEVGCLGAPDLIRSLLEQGYGPIAAIVGEPTNMTVVNSHKGFDLYRVTITGREAHSSLVNIGVSANMVAADLLTVLAEIAREEERSHRDERFEPQWSTLTVGTIQGGTAPNILARECRFVFDLRCIPGREPESVLEPFREAVARIGTRIETAGEGAGILLTRLATIPPLRQETDGAAEPLSALLSGIDGAGTAVPYSAEAGQFQQAGLSTVLCGPGSIAQAHRADEFIELRQIEAGARFVGRLVEFVQ